MNKDNDGVWIFSGNVSKFPSAVFTTKIKAEKWIKDNNLQGVLTWYPLDLPVIDWFDKEISYGKASDLIPDMDKPSTIANFSTSYQEHYHYGDN